MLFNLPKRLGARGGDPVDRQEPEALRQHSNGGDGSVETVDFRICHYDMSVALVLSRNCHDVRQMCLDTTCPIPE
jgi:hypothetical protein